MKNSLFYRRKGILLLLEEFGSRVGKTEFQKYLFLWTVRQEKPIYDFVPYKYGCFSFQSYHDLGVLKNFGYVDETTKSWLLKKKINKDKFKKEDLISLKDIRNEYKSVKGDQLLKAVCLKYPYYAINSESAEDVLTRSELKSICAEKPTGNHKVLFTIGYQGRSIDSFMNFLIKNNVHILCDVRKNPLSRKYGFSKNQLRNICEKLKIEYISIPDLGIKSEIRYNLSSVNDYKKLFKDYKKDVLRREKSSLELIIGLLKNKRRVAITCFEKEPEMCHRHCVADAVYKKMGQEIRVVNL